MCTSLSVRSVVVALTLLGLALPLTAQDRWSSSLFGGIALPMGDFADDSGADAGLATTGIVLGGDLAMRVGSSGGLEWLSTAQVVTFGVDDSFLEGIPPDASVELGRYWGAQFMTGLRYRFGEEVTRAHLVGQLVVGGMRAPNATISQMGEEAVMEWSWQPVKGISAGFGASFGERVAFEARYETLINPEIIGELRFQGTVEDLEAEQPMSWLRVTVAITVG